MKEVTEQHVYYSTTYILLYSLENPLQIFSRGYLFPTCNFTVNFFPFTYFYIALVATVHIAFIF